MQTNWAARLMRATDLANAGTIALHLQKMLDEGFHLDEPLEEMQMAPPLLVVVVAGNHLVLTEMLRLGANPNVQIASTGETPMMFVSTIGWIRPLQTLLEAGAETEMQDNEGQTVLHIAAANLNPEAVSLLLRHGANRFHRDHANRSVSDKARASGIAFAGALPSWLEWSPRHKVARDAALAENVAEIIALLKDVKAAE